MKYPRTDLTGRPWQERWKGRNLVRGRRARVCHSTLLPAIVSTQVNQAMLLTKQQIPNTVVPCYPKGVPSKTPHWMPEIMDSTETHIYYVISDTCIPKIKLHS